MGSFERSLVGRQGKGTSMSDKNMGKSTSGTAIAGLVLGIVAAVSSWVPIVNNLSFLIGLVGLVLAVVGLVGVMRGKKSGKGLAIAALVVNVAAIVIVLGTQSAMSAAIDEATSGSAVSDVSAQSTGDTDTTDDAAADATAPADDQQASTDLAPGASVTLDNGLVVTVDSVETGLANFDGSTVTGAHVTYVNNGGEGASYNSYDWKGEDAEGAQEYTTYYSESTDDLGSGTLAAGGTKSGMVYFEGDTAKVLYFGSMLSDTPTASWVVE